MQILGVDEAGRGCVMGPLVVAGVLIEEGEQFKLVQLGVRDSKLLSSLRREQLAQEIRRIATATCIIKLSPREIDKAVRSGRKLHKLNRLEAQTMARIIEKLGPDVAIVDASDVLADRYKQHIIECLSAPVRVVSEHKADKNHPAVSAASIIAKVERDHHIEMLKTQHGDFGSGYMTDPKTKSYLEKLAKECKEYPYFVRCSWKPAIRTKNNAKGEQAKLV
jgi:ribonuclease HII